MHGRSQLYSFAKEIAWQVFFLAVELSQTNDRSYFVMFDIVRSFYMPMFHTLTVSDIRRETPEAVSVAFDVPDDLADAFRFKQGQYLTLKTLIKGEEVRRSYSVCVSPYDEELRVAVKQVPYGKFSTFVNEELQVGDKLEAMPPLGKFFTEMDSDHEHEYVAFAAGSGITPIMSILKTVLKAEPKSRFTLFYSNKTQETIIFRDALEDLKNLYMERLSVHHLLSREDRDSPLFNGRLNGEKCRKFANLFFDPPKIEAYFICGPESMLLDLRDSLRDLGVTDQKIHFELFGTGGGAAKKKAVAASGVAVSSEEESRVRVIIDGDGFEFKLPYAGESVLDAALKAGGDLPYACKGGVCCTCKAKVIEGKVDMLVNYALEPDEVEAGFVLTCQAHPRSERIVVDFDV